MTLNEDIKWRLIKQNIENGSLVHHQLQSYNSFISGLSTIVNHDKIKLSENHYIELYNLHVDKPVYIETDRTEHILTPHMARTKDLTYESVVSVSIKEVIIDSKTNENKTTVTNRIELCRIPAMLKSSICHLNGISKHDIIKYKECTRDDGGYFIVRGKERVIIAQLRNCYNKPLIFDDSTDNITCEIRSMSSTTGHSILSKVTLSENNKFSLSISLLKESVPLSLIFNALGYYTFDEIYDFVNIKDNQLDVDYYIQKLILGYLVNVDKDMPETEKRKEYSRNAFEQIGKLSSNVLKSSQYEEYGKQVVKMELFPHLGTQSNDKEKALFIGSMVKKIILLKLGKTTFDDRDNYVNKRIETTGILCEELFKQLYKKFKDYMINIIQKKKQQTIDILHLFLRSNIITSGIKYCFSTGNWGIQRTAYVRLGVSQVLSRLSYGSTISHKRRISIPIGKESKNTKIRQIQQSQIMFICPCETPEGQSVGIVLNLALFTRITNENKNTSVLTIDHIRRLANIKSTDETHINQIHTLVFVNNVIVGITYNTKELLKELNDSRDAKYIDHDTSITYNSINNEIHIYTDSGRLVRPLLTMNNNKILFDNINDKNKTWDQLVYDNIIKYIDNNEVENVTVAFNDASFKLQHKYDYCEIDPCLMLGVMGSIIPWPDHSQSPRNCYQTSMGKQAMSFYSSTYQHRTDTISHVISYPQKPIVNTKIAEYMGFSDMPSGINVICAILCYTGFNQEDSLIINKSAIDRGLFHAYSYRTHTDQEYKHSVNIIEKIEVPDLEIQKSDLNYHFLDKRGVIQTRINNKAVYVKKGDVLIGKVIKESSKTSKCLLTDSSLSVKKGEEGFIDRVVDEITPDGYRIVKVIIRTERIPEIGDKFASRSAQKGTCGIVYSQEDMPFTSDGITPDIIINPHCIPSRMTINQLMETAFSKSCVLKGKLGDSTPFGKSSIKIAETIKNELGMTGFKGDCTEVMYNGFDGNKIGSVFIGPVFYQRLKHLVSEKMHARSTGSVTTLTRQPLEGRSRDGGLRFGEMERDAMISHGTSIFLKDRLCDQSDPYHIYVCNMCHQISNTKDKCQCNNTIINKVETPYVTKLLIQELQAVGIKVDLKVK